MRADSLLVNCVLILYGANQLCFCAGDFVVVLFFVSSLISTTYASVCSKTFSYSSLPYN